jgi:hypothetical protein
VNFFPAYPFLGRLTWRITGIYPGRVLLAISNGCFLATFALLALYVRPRFADLGERYVYLVLLAFALFPFNFYYVANYSEPMFILIAVAVLYGIERRWPLVTLAFLVGLATGTRLTGLALLPPLAFAIWNRSPSWTSFALRSVGLAPLTCWGLLGFMALQYRSFGDPLAFVQTQVHWMNGPPPDVLTKLTSLATFKPIWSLFVAGSSSYWHGHMPFAGSGPLLVGVIWHTVFFVLAAVLVGIGAWKRWLNGYEIALAGGLLAIPYVAKSVEMSMYSMGRYASVAFPIYLVLGRILLAMPRPAASATLAAGAVMLGWFAMLASRGYLFY